MNLSVSSTRARGRPSVDAAAAEALRGRLERHHDRASRRAPRAPIDVSVVLKPQQRQAGWRSPQAAPAAF